MLDRFLIVGRIGGGGMGDVYRATDTSLDREVAIKVPRLSPHDGEEILLRFISEAKVVAKLSHPNLCRIYNVGEDRGLHWFAMRYVEGENLRDLIDNSESGGHPFAAEMSVRIVATIADAIQYAHDSGVFHRDIKPGNIMFDPRSGEPIVMDFGLALPTQATDGRLTASGAVLGTPAYMPLEQANGDLPKIGPHSDVHSLGAVLYELLTGRPPVQGSYAQMFAELVAGKPTPPSKVRPVSDPALDAICLKALGRRPEDRYRSMAAFAKALREWTRRRESGERGLIPINIDLKPGAPRGLTAVGPVLLRGSMIKQKASSPTPTSAKHAADGLKQRLLIAAAGGATVTILVVAGIAYALSGSGDAQDVAEEPPELTTGARDEFGGPEPHEGEGNASPLPSAPVSPAPTTSVPIEPTPGPSTIPSVTPVAVGTRAGEVRTFGSPPIEFCWCPPGNFMMGSPDDEWARGADETQVRVSLTQGFWLGKTEVTQATWRSVMHTEPWKGREQTVDDDRCPVAYVSWNDAAEFCRKLTELERASTRLPMGWEFALPTEAQWEYACRAGTTTPTHFGGDASQLSRYAVFFDNGIGAGIFHVQPVDGKEPNDWSLHDMYGNVVEWCRDGYATNLLGGEDPYKPPSGELRSARSTGYGFHYHESRSANRIDWPAGRSSMDSGLRVALVQSDTSNRNFVPLFDGRTLAGWEGEPRFWTVEDGAIVGRESEENPLQGGTYLVWRGGKPADFKLRLKIRFEKGSSGVFYRGQEVRAPYVTGYEADLDNSGRFSGAFFDSDRNWLASRGQRLTIGVNGDRTTHGTTASATELASCFKVGDWNELEIEAIGNRHIHHLNGVKTIELFDEQTSYADADGVIAFQLIDYGTTTVWFKDIELLDLGTN